MRRHIASHAALRGVAALMVVGYHLRFGAPYLLPFERATQAFARSYLWVDFFFVLSGFIISYTVAPDNRPIGRSATRAFFLSRISRICPLHWACLAAIILFQGFVALVKLRAGQPIGDHWSPLGLWWTVQEALLIHAWGIDGAQGWNIPSWSISAEMFAYLLFPLLLLVMWRTAGLLALLAFSAAFYLWIGATTGSLDIIVGLSPLRCLAGFVLGMALCHYRELWTPLSDRTLNALQIAALAGIAAGLHWQVNDSLLILPFVLLVGASWTDRGAIARLYRAPACQYLGRISYSIYLTHVFVIGVGAFFWSRAIVRFDIPPEIARAVILLYGLGATVALSGFTYRYIEEPARRHFTRRRKPPEAAAATR